MSKLNREAVIAAALDLLDEVGLDAISTRQLAKRLGVEQPSLYWHFRKKEDLLAAMAATAMAPHATKPLPTASDDWAEWFRENTRSFRRTLLMRRDGARLHAGSRPTTEDMERIFRKLDFLIASGVPEHDARAAMIASGRFTVGSVLEEQAEASFDVAKGEPPADGPSIDHEAVFEDGLSLILDGLAARLPGGASAGAGGGAVKRKGRKR